MPNEVVTVRGLFSAMVADPWRKLVSLMLAVLLWHYLDAQVSDKDNLTMTLVATHTASDLETSKGLRLFVRMNLNEYSVIDFRDAATGEVRDSVTLYFAGTKRLIQTLDENRGFLVGVEPTLEQGELLATFGAADVRPIDFRFEGLIDRMDPPRIRVHVGRNVRQGVILARERIDLKASDAAAELLKHLQWADARFEPPAVTLQGPEAAVERLARQGKLYQLDVKPPAPGESQLKAALRAMVLESKVTVAPETVALTVPLVEEPKRFRLPEVPVRLIETDAMAGRFKLQNNRADVDIEALGTLDAVLSGQSVEDLRGWVRNNNVVLIAFVPADAERPDTILDLHLVMGRFLEGIDYRVILPPPIHLENAR